ncbi:hypothetical protein [Actinokineospora pegani]|uniref:hypothetical protein n=1 Tax=Actinokineospora pegani TaxID=2654637 RepID=UPI0012E9D1F6|nr:hypothetical protein [Actinokineospora pegani]
MSAARDRSTRPRRWNSRDAPAAPDDLCAAFHRIGLDTGPAFHSITATTADAGRAPGAARRVRAVGRGLSAWSR